MQSSTPRYHCSAAFLILGLGFGRDTFAPMRKLAEELGMPAYAPANTLVSNRHFDNLSGQQACKCFARTVSMD